MSEQSIIEELEAKGRALGFPADADYSLYGRAAKHVAELEADNESWRKQNQNDQALLGKLEAEAKAKDERIKELSEEFQQKQAEVIDCEAAIASLREEVEKLRQRLLILNDR